MIHKTKSFLKEHKITYKITYHVSTDQWSKSGMNKLLFTIYLKSEKIEWGCTKWKKEF